MITSVAQQKEFFPGQGRQKEQGRDWQGPRQILPSPHTGWSLVTAFTIEDLLHAHSVPSRVKWNPDKKKSKCTLHSLEALSKNLDYFMVVLEITNKIPL